MDEVVYQQRPAGLIIRAGQEVHVLLQVQDVAVVNIGTEVLVAVGVVLVLHIMVIRLLVLIVLIHLAGAVVLVLILIGEHVVVGQIRPVAVPLHHGVVDLAHGIVVHVVVSTQDPLAVVVMVVPALRHLVVVVTIVGMIILLVPVVLQVIRPPLDLEDQLQLRPQRQVVHIHLAGAALVGLTGALVVVEAQAQLQHRPQPQHLAVADQLQAALVHQVITG